MSPNQWITPTNKSVTGRGKNSSITGTIIVEVPKPEKVPTIDATKTSRVRISSSKIISFYL